MSAAERAGFSPDRLAHLDRVLKDQYVGAGDLPCAAIEIWRGGQLAHSGMWGHLDIERGVPIRADAIYRIYSMTKPITGAAVLVLMDDRLIDLDDEVERFVPAFNNIEVLNAGRTEPTKRKMRIIDLLTHTAGLTYDWTYSSPVDAAYRDANIVRRDLPGGLEAFVAALGKLPLEFSPGEHWNYSVAMDVLAYIVQVVSGMSFGTFLKTRIFDPLGMVDTAHHCPPEKIERLTSCYEIRDGRLTRDEQRTHMFAVLASLEEGGAGLLSTTRDYARFCRMLLAGGTLDGVRVLSASAVSFFSMNMLPGGRTLGDLFMPGRGTAKRMDGDGFSIGCGVTLSPGQKHAAGSPGDFYWSGAQMTQFWVDPAEDLAVVFMTQVMGSSHHFRIARVLRSLVYGAIVDRHRPI